MCAPTWAKPENCQEPTTRMQQVAPENGLRPARIVAIWRGEYWLTRAPEGTTFVHTRDPWWSSTARA